MSAVPSRRVYSEQEVTKIIARASEISEAEDTLAFSPGVTEDELIRLAKEVGISGAALEKSLAEHNDFTEQRGGSAFVEVFEGVVEGEVDESDLDLVLEGLRTLNVSADRYIRIGRSIEFRLWTGISQAKVTLQARNGRTRISVRSDSEYPLAMSLVPSFALAGLGGAILASQGAGVVAAIVATSVLAIGWNVFRRIAGAGHRRARKLLDRLKENVSRATEQREVQPTTVAENLSENFGTDEGAEEQTLDLRSN